MGLKICSISSGSRGNCIYIASDTTKILVDVGVSATRVSKTLTDMNVSAADMNVLVTHAHSDHISGVPGFCAKYGSTVYAHYKTAAALSDKKGITSENLIEFGDNDFYVGDITVTPFAVSHDVPCVGYSFLWRGKKISVATDMGFVSPKTLDQLADSDIVFLESNHDETMVKNNVRYAAWLKQRILGSCGHLSNNSCADTAAKLASAGVKQIILGHLSQENNYPELARSTVYKKFVEMGCEKDVPIDVALQDRRSIRYEIC